MARRICIVIVVAGSLVVASSQATAAVPKLKRESYSVFLTQVSGRKVRTAVLVPKKKILHARLKRGTRYLVKYPGTADRRLVRLLHAKRVHVAFAQPSKHHHRGSVRRRLIAAAGVGALALALLAWYLVRRPRPPRESTAAARAGTNPGSQPEG